jgi:SAM-dependent methyltransferase
MFDTINPYCSGNVIEIGSGIGNISRFCLHAGWRITLSDVRTNYCEELKTKFSSYSNLKGVIKVDLTHPDFDNAYSGILNSFDTLFALNVVEHINDDNLAIKNCYKLLKSGGVIITLVPAYRWLYNSFDKTLEHYRRYNRKSLTRLIKKNNFKIFICRYFNFAGIFGWFFFGTILKHTTIPERQMSIYNKLVPLFKVTDALTFHQAGLSVICAGKKK